MRKRQLICLGICSAVLILTSCGEERRRTRRGRVPVTPQRPPATADAAAPAPGSWTPEALRTRAPIAALSRRGSSATSLTASTNPQEVLDAGNWLIDHQDLSGGSFASTKPRSWASVRPTRALLQFPEAVDMMCMQMDWTTQLGQAFTADQGAVLDAVQRLRTASEGRTATRDPRRSSRSRPRRRNGKEIVTVAPAESTGRRLRPEVRPMRPCMRRRRRTIPPPTTISITSGAGTTIATPTARHARRPWHRPPRPRSHRQRVTARAR